MRLPYTTTIRDELLNIDVIPDLECELDIDCAIDCGDPVFDVTAVLVDGKNLYGGSAYSKAIAAGIATEATGILNMVGTRLRGRAIEADAMLSARALSEDRP